MEGVNLQENVDRFFSWVERSSSDTDCWLWVGYRDISGYGRFNLPTGQSGGHPVAAHRFSFEMVFGPIPAGYHIHHKCNNPPCVNPLHLAALTPLEHAAATPSHMKNQTHCIRGHEFTEENTHRYRGKRSCRACAVLRFMRKRDPLYQEKGSFSKLYCKNEHPLFGSNIYLAPRRGGGYVRHCRTCQEEHQKKFKEGNRQAILAGKAKRRLAKIAERRQANRDAILDLIANAKNLPDMVVWRTAGRLMRDVD